MMDVTGVGIAPGDVPADVSIPDGSADVTACVEREVVMHLSTTQQHHRDTKYEEERADERGDPKPRRVTTQQNVEHRRPEGSTSPRRYAWVLGREEGETYLRSPRLPTMSRTRFAGVRSSGDYYPATRSFFDSRWFRGGPEPTTPSSGVPS